MKKSLVMLCAFALACLMSPAWAQPEPDPPVLQYAALKAQPQYVAAGQGAAMVLTAGEAAKPFAVLPDAAVLHQKNPTPGQHWRIAPVPLDDGYTLTGKGKKGGKKHKAPSTA